MAKTDVKELLDAGVHFGHLTRKWNPNMAPYIYMERNGIHIINLYKTAAKLEESVNAIKKIVLSGRKILFVATKKQAKETGDYDVLSKTDIDIITLAYECKGTIVTDDFAIQNVALALGLEFLSCTGKEITEKRFWRYKCTACNHKEKEKKKDCPICGNTEILRIKSK